MVVCVLCLAGWLVGWRVDWVVWQLVGGVGWWWVAMVVCLCLYTIDVVKQGLAYHAAIGSCSIALI